MLKNLALSLLFYRWHDAIFNASPAFSVEIIFCSTNVLPIAAIGNTLVDENLISTEKAGEALKVASCHL